MSKYSVLMSVYVKENPDFFKTSIESMLGQTLLPDQIVIVKDGPLNDELDDVINFYTEKYPDMFTIVPLENNVGLGRALDIGLVECRNELVARMDTDDISLPQRCEKQVKLFDEIPQLGIVGTNIDEFYDNPDHIVSSRVVPSEYSEIVKFMRRRSPFNHPAVMFKKSEVIRCGGYGKMKRKQDLDLFARMINMDCYALNINESLLLFRSNADNYKRRKSWEYCKSYIDVSIENYKRGYCSLFDLAYVICGQLALYLAPQKLMKFMSDKLLRSNVK